MVTQSVNIINVNLMQWKDPSSNHFFSDYSNATEMKSEAIILIVKKNDYHFVCLHSNRHTV